VEELGLVWRSSKLCGLRRNTGLMIDDDDDDDHDDDGDEDDDDYDSFSFYHAGSTYGS
jgi:hypothetical protein